MKTMFNLWADKYDKLSWCSIPIRPNDKCPLIEWREFQERRPTPQELQKWGETWPDANIGIVTGRVSAIIVFDVDGPEAEKFVMDQGGFPITPQSKTSRGFHYVLKYPDHLSVRNSSNKQLLLDVKGDGGYSVVEPSSTPPDTSINGLTDSPPSMLTPRPFAPGWRNI